LVAGGGGTVGANFAARNSGGSFVSAIDPSVTANRREIQGWQNQLQLDISGLSLRSFG
jgi:hypothetical protein